MSTKGQLEFPKIQNERWAALVDDCKSRQGNINAGGKTVRQAIIEMDTRAATAERLLRILFTRTVPSHYPSNEQEYFMVHRLNLTEKQAREMTEFLSE